MTNRAGRDRTRSIGVGYTPRQPRRRRSISPGKQTLSSVISSPIPLLISSHLIHSDSDGPDSVFTLHPPPNLPAPARRCPPRARRSSRPRPAHQQRYSGGRQGYQASPFDGMSWPRWNGVAQKEEVTPPASRRRCDVALTCCGGNHRRCRSSRRASKPSESCRAK